MIQYIIDTFFHSIITSQISIALIHCYHYATTNKWISYISMFIIVMKLLGCYYLFWKIIFYYLLVSSYAIMLFWLTIFGLAMIGGIYDYYNMQQIENQQQTPLWRLQLISYRIQQKYKYIRTIKKPSLFTCVGNCYE